MKNQIIIKDGDYVVCLTSSNFFISYNTETQNLRVQRDDLKTLRFTAVADHIPNGKSHEAIQEELERDIPVFRCVDSN